MVKQLDELKKDLEKQYGVNIEEFLMMYADNVNLKAIIKHFDVSPWYIKMVAATLNLRFAKKHRRGDIAMFMLRSNDKADDDLMLTLKDKEEALEQLSSEFIIQAKTLVRTRRQANILRKDLRDSSASEGIYSFIGEAVKSVEPMGRPKGVPTVNYNADGKIQFAVLSDLHAEEIVDNAQVPTGDYSWEIMESRVKQIFSSLLEMNQGFKLLDLYILGDLISGFIHGSDVNASKHPIIALTSLAELLAEQIALVSPTYLKVRIFTTTGNHDRLTDNPSIINKSYDFSYLLYKLMESHLMNYENVEFDISETGLGVVPIGKNLNTYVGISHGDQVSSGANKSADLKTIEFFRGTMGVDVHHLIQGHYHVPSISALGARGFSITNGSLIGPGSYSHVKGFIPTPWSQFIGVWGSNGNLETLHTISD